MILSILRIQRCDTASCWETSRRVLANLNTSTSPCDDFYGYACGGWTQSHNIPDDKSAVSQFDLLRDRNLVFTARGVNISSTAATEITRT